MSDPSYPSKVPDTTSYQRRRRWGLWVVAALLAAVPVAALAVAQFRRCGPVPRYDARGVAYAKDALEAMVARGDTLAASDTLFRHPDLVSHECSWR